MTSASLDEAVHCFLQTVQSQVRAQLFQVQFASVGDLADPAGTQAGGAGHHSHHRMFQAVNKEMATNTYCWFFLIQPYDFPERMIGASADYFIRRGFERGENTAQVFPAEAVAEYVRCFCDPAAIHATCEDYRAGADIDLVHDEADLDNKVGCPLLALWSATGYVGRTQDVLQVWREYATDVRGHSLACGHHLAEELPDETYAALREFLLE